MISDMERIGDQAEDIAEITKSIKKPKEEICGDHISDMTKTAISMVTESVDSFVKKDLEIARAVIKKDDIVDELFLEVKDDIINAVREDKAEDRKISGTHQRPCGQRGRVGHLFSDGTACK